MAHNSYLTFGKREGQNDFPTHLISGIPSFLKADVVPPVADQLRDHGAKAAVLGLPWEHTNTCRPGTAMGPRAIRSATDHYISHHGEFQVDLFEALRLVDCGDVQIIPGNARRTFDRAEECIGNIVDAGAIPFVFGGDDSCPIPVTAALSRSCGSGGFAYIHFDSHMDTARDVGGEILNHACPVSRTAELANCKKVSLLGINGALNPPDERAFVDEYGIQMFTIWDIEEQGVDAVMAQVIEHAWSGGVEKVVLHTDLDCMDQAFVPGVTTPETGGMTPREMIKFVRGFARKGIDAYVITECSPVYDPANNAARVAVRLAMDVMGTIANPQAKGRV
jgi:agmatinase